ALLEVARRGLALAEKSPGSGPNYIWSKRVLNAELNLCENADERIAARERYLKTTVRLEEITKKQVAEKILSEEGMMEAEYPRCEAQAQLDAERNPMVPARR